MAKRIYKVLQHATQIEYLVNANTPAQALRAVAKTQYAVEVANQTDLVRLVSRDVPVIEAGDEPEAVEETANG